MKRRIRHVRSRGQIMVILAVGTLVLLAFTGFALDLAQYLIFRAQLRRAVDAAAIAAASHFRGQYSSVSQMRDGMERAAKEVLALNGFDVSSVEIVTSIDTTPTVVCDDPASDATTVPDKYICFPRQRKKVWVKASVVYHTAFIRLFGFKTITVTASAVGESASMDVVLIIDISSSLAYGHGSDPTKPDHELDDPYACNQHPNDFTNGCLPFEYIRSAAKQFARKILDLSCVDPTDPTNCMEQDRLSIVVFSTGWESDPGNFRGTFVVRNSYGHPWFRKRSEVLAKLNSLKVYDPGVTTKEWVDAGALAWPGSARHYTRDGTVGGEICAGPGDSPCEYVRNVCLPFAAGIDDISTCMSTNLGGALQLARSVLSTDFRSDALRVVILLSTGVPNATFADTDGHEPPVDDTDPPQWKTTLTSTQLHQLPFGYCPPDTQYSWKHPSWGIPDYGQCRDLDVAYLSGGRWKPQRRTNMSDVDFDAEDYAYYYVDAIACPQDATEASARGCAVKGMEAIMYAVGIGEEVISTDVSESGDPPAGAMFLRYAAAAGDDHDPRTDICQAEGKPFRPPASQNKQKCGNYFWIRSGSDISAVFDEIARRIFTRLSH